jgi:hypothetical protein
MKGGIYLIAEERQRQIEVEGWTFEHDDSHRAGELAAAAVCYALPHFIRTENLVNALWPWNKQWWKPAIQPLKDTRIRELAKAGALIAAEIDRLQRYKP